MAKFRSWNETEKRFYYFENGRYYKTAECNKKRCNCVSERICSEFNWQKAEQSTGLFDKHGKEIYVGDKVKFNDSVGDGEEYQEFENTAVIKNYAMPIFCLDEFEREETYCYNNYDNIELEDILCGCEIVGHVHEGEM